MFNYLHVKKNMSHPELNHVTKKYGQISDISAMILIFNEYSCI